MAGANDLDMCLDFGEDSSEDEAAAAPAKTEAAPEPETAAAAGPSQGAEGPRGANAAATAPQDKQAAGGSWGKFAGGKATNAGAGEAGKFSALLSALKGGAGKEGGAEQAAAPVAAPSSITGRNGSSQGGSCTVMVTELPTACPEIKLRAHFARYGEVTSVECEGSRAFVVFASAASAQRAFMNRAPVLKDTCIQVFRLPDHSPSGRAAAVSAARRCPTRKVTERTAAPADGGAAVTAPVGAEGAADSGAASDKKDDEDDRKTTGGTKDAAAAAAAAGSSGADLYANISLDKPSAKSKAAPKGAAAAATAQAGAGRPRLEKRTWTRAGLANMNSKEVLQARIGEKKAAAQLGRAREQIGRLREELKKQQEQMALAGKDSKTIGKGLRRELMGNITALTVQMRNAQVTMTNAKNAVARAKKELENAIEKSKGVEADPGKDKQGSDGAGEVATEAGPKPPKTEAGPKQPQTASGSAETETVS